MRTSILLATAVALIGAPLQASAQSPQGVRMGQTIRGALGARDLTFEDRRFDAFAIRLREGERMVVTLESDDFDPVLQVGADASVFEPIAENDDGPGMGVNSRLVFTAPRDARYLIRALPLSGPGEGDYVLRLNRAPPPAPGTPIAIGDSVEGRLDADAPEGEAGRPAVGYAFQGRAGQRVRIEMRSDDFDAVLELFDPSRQSLAEDDDGLGEGTNSRLIATLPADGTYLVEARAFADGGEGAYALTLGEMEPERPAEPMTFGLVEGSIDDADPRDDDDSPYDAYRFSGGEGRRVQVIMRSGDFDTYLKLGSADGEFSALAEDDDGLGEGTDSRLNFVLPATGDYVIRASPLSASDRGLYSLELIDRGPQPAPGSLLIGETARGRLSETDATGEDGGYHDAYRVEIQEDEKLVLTLVSNEVDAVVSIGRVGEDGGVELLASDDDGLSDTNSRLEWTAPETGLYEIRAGSFQPGQTGVYALTVEKKP